MGESTPSPYRRVDNEYMGVRLEELDVVATLGMGGFGRVELVRTKKDTSREAIDAHY